MRIAVITAKPMLYSHGRLIEAAEQRGHRLDTITVADNAVSIPEPRPSATHDAVILRHGTTRTNFGMAILRQFELAGVWPLNPSAAISSSRNKFHCLQILSNNGLNIPLSAYSEDQMQAEALLQAVGGPPAVIKVLDGAHGVGVELCRTRADAIATFDAFYREEGNVMMQEFITEAKGSDIRCIVIGGKFVAAMRRQGAVGEFRSNLHQGGSAHPVEATDDEKLAAERAAQIMELNFCGVDMLRSDRGPLIIEVNSSPGLEGIEAVTGLDIASDVIDCIERRIGSVS
ncbi:MAG: RimK family alpha-L-glutamate ligase [Erythrobacter sp.]